MFCAGLVLPAVVLVKVRLPGTRVTAGSGEVPLPLRGIDCGLAGGFFVGAQIGWRGPPAGGGENKRNFWGGGGGGKGGEEKNWCGDQKGGMRTTKNVAGGERSSAP